MISLANQLQVLAEQKLSIEQRQAESPLATPSYRKDIYNILHKLPRQSLLYNTEQSTKGNPIYSSPVNTAFRTGPQSFSGSQINISNSLKPNEPASKKYDPKKTHLRWVFKMSPALNGQVSFNGCEFIATPDSVDNAMCDITLQALSAMGGVNEAGIAVTEAFERLLSKEYIPWWTQEDVESLSITFIAAFSRLLGGLDLAHAIRSRVLSAKDINLLVSIPHIKDTILPILELYQDPI
jgi:hypothetical protein